MTSTIKVNNIQNQCGANIVNKCSTTITLGASGDNIVLASGATQSGFGRTGTVDWDTTAKTASFTAVSGTGYFINTTSGAITVNLPAGSAGAIVSLADYTNTWQTNNVTVSPNGSDKIGGVAANATLSTEGQSVTFVYVDGTEGWKNVQDSTSNVTGNPNLVATGGTITTCGDYKIHTFTSPGTFCVSQIANTPANNIVSYLVVAGGGGGSNILGGAGGAGGFREYKGPADCYTASPLNGNPGGTAVTVTATAYPITVGGGGSNDTPGSNGSNSIFSTITSAGGGGGGRGAVGLNGGSGGGGHAECSPGAGGSGNTPPVSPPQGNPGGNNPGPQTYAGGSGGGAAATGLAQPGPAAGGAGAGTGINPSCTVGTPGPSPSLRYFAGGGGGSKYTGFPGTVGAGGVGGGGASVAGPASTSGTTNTGGGGGGSSYPFSPSPTGGAGGSGIVIIRYKYQ